MSIFFSSRTVSISNSVDPPRPAEQTANRSPKKHGNFARHTFGNSLIVSGLVAQNQLEQLQQKYFFVSKNS